MIKVCVVPRLEGARLVAVSERAIEERPENAPSVRTIPRTRQERVRLALLTGKAWKPGRMLRIRLLGGDRAVRSRVQGIAEEWQQHANIGFEFGADPDAEIRVAFSPGPSWSLHGTEALGATKRKPTMNLGWLTPETSAEEFSQVVLHEFGHALGCVHEHQSPCGGIPWDREAVYRYYAGPPNGWSAEEVDQNIFTAYEHDQTQFSKFDKASIMLYPVPNDLTIGDFEIGWNSTLSDTDKSFIAERYPFEDTSATSLECGVHGVAGSIRHGGDVDEYRFVVDAPGSFVLETSGSTDVLMSLLGPNSKTTPVAEDDNSGLVQNAKIEEFLRAGTYYVRVRHKRETGIGDYTLSLRKGG